MEAINIEKQLAGVNYHKFKRGFRLNILQACIYLTLIEELTAIQMDINWLRIEFAKLKEDTHITTTELLETIRFFEQHKLISGLVIYGQYGKQTACFTVKLFK